jgi:hypothetical protein
VAIGQSCTTGLPHVGFAFQTKLGLVWGPDAEGFPKLYFFSMTPAFAEGGPTPKRKSSRLSTGGFYLWRCN